MSCLTLFCLWIFKMNLLSPNQKKIFHTFWIVWYIFFYGNFNYVYEIDRFIYYAYVFFRNVFMILCMFFPSTNDTFACFECLKLICVWTNYWFFFLVRICYRVLVTIVLPLPDPDNPQEHEACCPLCKFFHFFASNVSKINEK